MWAGQSSRPSIRSRYTSSPTSRRSPPSRRRRFVHINASKVLPARGVDCAARGPARAARSPARRARRVPLRARLSHCGPLAARPAVTCTCSSTSVQQLPPRCSLLAAKVRCCPTGPTLSPRPAPHLPSPLGASHFPSCMSVQHRRPWAKSHCLSVPPSLPPAPLRPSSAGPRLPRPPPPARAGLALLRSPPSRRR